MAMTSAADDAVTAGRADEAAAPPPALGAMTSVLRLHQSMTAIVERVLRAGFDLSLTDYQMLRVLQDSPDHTSLLGQVARRLVVHPTTVTVAADRLERRQLAVRHSHPSDRRATLVTITDAGRRLTDGATTALESVDFGFPG